MISIWRRRVGDRRIDDNRKRMMNSGYDEKFRRLNEKVRKDRSRIKLTIEDISMDDLATFGKVLDFLLSLKLQQIEEERKDSLNPMLKKSMYNLDDDIPG